MYFQGFIFWEEKWRHFHRCFIPLVSILIKGRRLCVWFCRWWLGNSTPRRGLKIRLGIVQGMSGYTWGSGSSFVMIYYLNTTVKKNNKSVGTVRSRIPFRGTEAVKNQRLFFPVVFRSAHSQNHSNTHKLKYIFLNFLHCTSERRNPFKQIRILILSKHFHKSSIMCFLTLFFSKPASTRIFKIQKNVKAGTFFVRRCNSFWKIQILSFQKIREW